jgi:secreted PhoX family phosphatase
VTNDEFQRMSRRAFMGAAGAVSALAATTPFARAAQALVEQASACRCW